jgi:hypothetical protein
VSEAARTAETGPGFTVSQDRILSSYLIRRSLTVPLGLLCLFISGWDLYWQWLGFFTGQPQPAGLASWSVWLLPVGLVLVGIRKRLAIDCPHKRVIVSSGWFCLSLSPYITHQWDLERFDRIVIQRGKRLGFTAPAVNTPHRNNWNMRFRVKLMGDHEIVVNSYGSYQNARRLAFVLSTLTGFSMYEVF